MAISIMEGAKQLVDRARAGDQIATATISLVTKNAKEGIPKAKVGLLAIKKYIRDNPTFHGDGPPPRLPKHLAQRLAATCGFHGSAKPIPRKAPTPIRKPIAMGRPIAKPVAVKRTSVMPTHALVPTLHPVLHVPVATPLHLVKPTAKPIPKVAPSGIRLGTTPPPRRTGTLASQAVANSAAVSFDPRVFSPSPTGGNSPSGGGGSPSGGGGSPTGGGSPSGGGSGGGDDGSASYDGGGGSYDDGGGSDDYGPMPSMQDFGPRADDYDYQGSAPQYQDAGPQASDDDPSYVTQDDASWDGVPDDDADDTDDSYVSEDAYASYDDGFSANGEETLQAISDVLDYENGPLIAAVMLSHGPLLSNSTIAGLASSFAGEGRSGFAHGVRNPGSRTSDKRCRMGQCIGMARKLQAARHPDVPVSILSMSAGWEFGEDFYENIHA